MAIITRIQVRRDTTANWASSNPVLASGEIGYDTTLGKGKVGNGTSTWSQLNFKFGLTADDLGLGEDDEVVFQNVETSELHVGSDALVLSSSGIVVGATTISPTEITYLDGVSSNIQTQLNAKLATTTAATTYLALAGGTITGNFAVMGEVVIGSEGTNGHIGLYDDVTDTEIELEAISGGLQVNGVFKVGSTLSPSANDGAALGTSALGFSDLFLASGAVINFNNGDVTVTHSSNTLTFAGASSGYVFDALVSTSGNVQLSTTGAFQWGASGTSGYIARAYAVGKFIVSNTTNFRAFTIDSGTTDNTCYILEGAGTNRGALYTGGLGIGYAAKTADYTLTAFDGTINCTSGTFALTLHTAVGFAGLIHNLKNVGSGVITINTTSSQTIDGNASGTLTLSQWDSLTVQSDGANWIIL